MTDPTTSTTGCRPRRAVFLKRPLYLGKQDGDQRACMRLLVPDDKVYSDKAAAHFLFRLLGIGEALNFRLLAVAKSRQEVSIYSQLTFHPQDLPIVQAALTSAFPSIEMRHTPEVFQMTLSRMRAHPDLFTHYPFDLRDVAHPDLFSTCSTRRFLTVANALYPGEILIQDLLAMPLQNGLLTGLRYGAFALPEHLHPLLNTVVGIDRLPHRSVFTNKDYRQYNLGTKTTLIDFLSLRLRHKGHLVSPDQVAHVAIPAYKAKSHDSLRITVQTLVGNAPHPTLSSGAPIGYSLYDHTNQIICLPESVLTRSIHVIGESGMGKSTVLEHLAAYFMHQNVPRYSLMLIESKGPLFDRVLSLVPKERVQDVVLYEPHRRPFPFNGIAPLKSGLDRDLTATCFTRSVEGRNRDGFSANARLLFRHALDALAPFPGATFHHVTAYLSDKKFRNTLLKLNPDDEVHRFIQTQFPAMTSVSFTAVYNKLVSFLSEPLCHATCQFQHELDFAKLIPSGHLVLADLSELAAEPAKDLGTLISARAISSAFKAGRNGDLANKWSIHILDEFHRWALPDLLSDILAQGRGLRTSAILAHQTLRGQISPELGATILGNVGTIVCFRLQQQDAYIMAGVLGVSKDLLSNLDAYQAVVKVDNLPAVIVNTLPPLQARDDIADQARKYSYATYHTSPLETRDPYGLFDLETQTTIDFDPLD
jgi:hypothetical protein